MKKSPKFGDITVAPAVHEWNSSKTAPVRDRDELFLGHRMAKFSGYY